MRLMPLVSEGHGPPLHFLVGRYLWRATGGLYEGTALPFGRNYADGVSTGFGVFPRMTFTGVPTFTCS